VLLRRRFIHFSYTLAQGRRESSRSMGPKLDVERVPPLAWIVAVRLSLAMRAFGAVAPCVLVAPAAAWC
jgi:hypothetical protein